MSPGLGLGLGLAKIVSLTPPHRSIRRIRRVAPVRYDVVAVDGVATAVEVGGRGHCQPGARLSQLRDLVRDATLRVRQGDASGACTPNGSPGGSSGLGR